MLVINWLLNIVSYSLFLVLCVLRHWIRKASDISEKKSLKKGTNVFRRRTAESCRRQKYDF